jgi:hypothetical protein
MGLAMLWPFSKARLSPAVPWFEVLDKPLPHFDAHSARVLLIELASYGPLFLLALACRWLWGRHKRRQRRAPDRG